MAYYSSSYYGSDYGDYYTESTRIPYYTTYDSALVHDSVVDQFFAYDHTPYYGAYDSVSTCSRIGYSASSFSEPIYVEYDLSLLSAQKTQLVVSYSVSDFNIPEFEDYDPNPYGGGYDPAAEYGKPLPPSDEICYPRSISSPDVLPLNGLSHGLDARKKEEANEFLVKPETESKPSSALATDDIEQQLPELGIDQGDSQEKVLDSHQGQDWSGQQDLSDKQFVPQMPSGYGLEAVDICESIFGYWPCLEKYASLEHDRQELTDRNYSNPWRGTADYLFGNSNPYNERRDHYGSSYENTVYGYQRHFLQEQCVYQQVESVQQVEYVVDVDPWLR